MSDKKQNILNAALDLFANEGYNATSTSKIAKQAGVSEGLIFRHFENKKGLLNAIYAQLEERLQTVLAGILFENDPGEVVRKYILVPRLIKETDYDFWRLQYILKWQPEYNNPDKLKPVLEKLSAAFKELGYDQPKMEARLLTMIIDEIGKLYLLNQVDDKAELESFLLKKYGL